MILENYLFRRFYKTEGVSEHGSSEIRYKVPTFGEAMGESFLEAVVRLNKNEDVDSKSIEKIEATNLKIDDWLYINLTINKHYGNSIFELGDYDIFFPQNLVIPVQIEEVFNVNIYYCINKDIIYYELNDDKSEISNQFGIFITDQRSKKSYEDKINLLFEHIISPVFIKFLLMNWGDSEFLILLKLGGYNHAEVVVDIVNDYNNLFERFISIKERFNL